MPTLTTSINIALDSIDSGTSIGDRSNNCLLRRIVQILEGLGVGLNLLHTTVLVNHY